MKIELIGINYKKTPVAIRSKVAIGGRQLNEALNQLHKYIEQGIILCTCNRTEIYVLCDDSSPEPGSLAFLAARSGLTASELLAHVYRFEDRDAVAHLFRVAAGLDSMLIGEYEVLGQVKHALKAAQDNGQLQSLLLDLFRYAMRAGRQVRTKTEISRNALSVSSVAVDTATKIKGDMKRCKIIVIGAGEAGRLAARAAKDKGALDITIVSRSARKGNATAKALGGQWYSMVRLPDALAAADIAICCSAAPHTVLKLDMVKKAMLCRPDRALAIIDIGVPANVEAGVKKLRNVFFYGIDDLINICRKHLGLRRDEIQKAEKIVEKAVDDFMLRWHEHKVTPLIKALMQKGELIRQNQLRTTLKRMPGLSSEEHAQFEMMSKSLINKLLHEPIECLKLNHKNTEYLRIVNELFSLENMK